MDNFIVNTSNKLYPIYFCDNFDFIEKVFKENNLKNRKICILSDKTVSKLYLEEVKQKLKNNFSEIYTFSFDGGEKSKNLESINATYEYFLKSHFDRKTIVLALGGGVVGDMAGFAAATYMRGIKFVQFPTTLLSQVDSSVGGKVGVDYKGVKNIIGSFYQPEFVYINVSALKTLPKREFSAGMAEIIKYGMILSYEFYNFIVENKENIKFKNTVTLNELIKKCCIFKAKVVAEDEKESGLREILNFGHTVGHAVESLKGFELLHGECVGIGMTAAIYISYKRGNILLDELNKFIEILKYFDIPVNVSGLNKEDVYAQMFNDKKVKDNKLNFVLLEKIGKCFRTSDISKQEILEALNYIL